MKTNYSDLTTRCEAVASTSKLFAWYSHAAQDNELLSGPALFRDACVDTTGGWVGVSLTSTHVKYGTAGAAYTAVSTSYDPPDPETYRGKTLTYSTRMRGTLDDTAQCYISDDTGATFGTLATLQGLTEFVLAEVTKVIHESATTVVIGTRKTGSDTCYFDGNKLELSGSKSNWSSRFFDVDDKESDGSLFATQFQDLLCGRIEIEIVPDENAPAPMLAWTQRASFSIVDDGSTVSKWTKQGTGIMFSVGDDGDATYAQQTRVFHGIIWDWALRAGTSNTYDVTACGLERLWQNYVVGPEAANGPRAWGIVHDTITTEDNKFVYQLPSAQRSGGAFVYKAVYDDQEVNVDNRVVCKWPFGTTTEATHMLHALWPVVADKTLKVDYFEGLGATDLVSHFESEMDMTENMPYSRRGLGGDAFNNAHACSFSHLPEQSSAWRNLIDSAGVELYSVRYDENGQIILTAPAMTVNMLEDFETIGDFTVSAMGTIAADTAHVTYGTYAVEVNKTGSTTNYVEVYKDFVAHGGTRDWSSYNQVHVDFYIPAIAFAKITYVGILLGTLFTNYDYFRMAVGDLASIGTDVYRSTFYLDSPHTTHGTGLDKSSIDDMAISLITESAGQFFADVVVDYFRTPDRPSNVEQARRTSESDASYAGEVIELTRLNDVYQVNYPCVKAEKFGVDSATGHGHPVQTATSYYDQPIWGPVIDDVAQVVSCAASPARSCPRTHPGHIKLQSFDDTCTGAFPRNIDTQWRANGANSGTVTIAGDGKVVIACPANADAAMIESINAEATTFACSVKVMLNSVSKNLAIGVKIAHGTVAGKMYDASTKLMMLLSTSSNDIYISYRNAADNDTLWRRNTGAGGVPAWNTGIGATGGKYALGTVYWITITYDGTNYRIVVCDTYGVPLGRACDASIAASSVLGGSSYLCIGDWSTGYNTCDVDILEIRYSSPAMLSVFRESIDSDPPNFRDLWLNAGYDYHLTDEWSWGINAIAPLPDRCDLNIRYNIDVDYGSHLRELMRVFSAPYNPAATSIVDAESSQTTLDGSSTVENSIDIYGYIGLKQGTWTNHFLTSDAEILIVTNKIAELNAEQRDMHSLRTKFNPWWDPHDLFDLTYFSEYDAQAFEVAGIRHIMDLRRSNGGAYTMLKIRKWTAL